jgi:hypothetical protein
MSYALLNPRDIEKYVRGICEGKFEAAATDSVCAALAPVLEKRAACLRLPLEADFAAKGSETLQFEMTVLGRKFYMFDPADDAELPALVLQAAKLIECMRESQQLFGAAGVAQQDMPRFMRQDFLASALTTQEIFAPAQQEAKAAALAAAMPEILREDVMKTLQESFKSVVTSAGRKNAPAATEVTMRLDDGWSAIRYRDYDALMEVNAAMKGAIGDIDRDKMQDGVSIYYGITDARGALKALLYTADLKEAGHMLFKCRDSGGRLPDIAVYSKILQFARHKDFKIAGPVEDTGLIGSGEKMAAFFDLPPHYRAPYAFKLCDYGGPVNLENLQGISMRSYERVLLKNCPGLISLGGLTQTNGKLEIDNCENLVSLGALRQVGYMDKFSSAIFTNCKKLDSLGKLEKVYGSLDIRGTSIREIPETLKKVKGHIHTDIGDFYFIGSARRAFMKHYGRQSKLLPGPGGMG